MPARRACVAASLRCGATCVPHRAAFSSQHLLQCLRWFLHSPQLPGPGSGSGQRVAWPEPRMARKHAWDGLHPTLRDGHCEGVRCMWWRVGPLAPAATCGEQPRCQNCSRPECVRTSPSSRRT